MHNYGFIYLSTNLINGMMYIGQTKLRSKMNDKYFGSGKAIKRAIIKNGAESFTRDILFYASSKTNLDWAEREFISIFDAVKSRMFYNIAPGGRASLGFTGKKHSKERNDALSEKMKLQSRGKLTIVAGKSYSSITAAAKDNNMNTLQMIHFLKTGIKPADRVNAAKGKSKKYPSPTTKLWRLMLEDGITIIDVFGLKPWCRERNINFDQLVKSKVRKVFVSGFMLI